MNQRLRHLHPPTCEHESIAMKPEASRCRTEKPGASQRAVLLAVLGLLGGCGGGGYGGSGGGGSPMSGYSAPNITMQPASVMVSAGQMAMFGVVATGPGPLSYQWMKNSVNIPGAVGPSYTTPTVSNADNNEQFAVTISNPYGSTTSNHAVLTVN